MGCVQSTNPQRRRERLSLEEKVEIENAKIAQLQRDLLEGNHHQVNPNFSFLFFFHLHQIHIKSSHYICMHRINDCLP